MHEISPELALVDPQLAAAVRARLRDPPDCLAPRARLVPFAPVAASTVAAVALAPARSRPRRILAMVATMAAWVVIAALIASPLLAFLPPDASMQPQILEQGADPAIDADAPDVGDGIATPLDPTMPAPIVEDDIRPLPPTVGGDPVGPAPAPIIDGDVRLLPPTAGGDPVAPSQAPSQ